MKESCLNRISSDYPKLSYWLLFIGIMVLVLDQLTKAIVSTYLPVIDSSFYVYPYGGIGIFQNWVGIEFSINHMTNTGAAWGAFGDYSFALMVLRISLILGLCFYLIYFPHLLSCQFSLILIITGAIGNVLDFFIYGHVIDMFHFIFWGYDFPVFNLADSVITIGVILLFVSSCFSPLGKA